MVKSGEVDVIRVLANGDEELLQRTSAPDQYFGGLGPFLGFPRIGVGEGGHRHHGHRLRTPESSVRRLHKH